MLKPWVETMSDRLDNIWRSLRPKNAEAAQAYFIGAYSIIGTFAFIAFGLQHIVNNGDRSVGYAELVFGAVFMLNLIALSVTWYRKHLFIAKSIIIVILFTFLLVMLVSGGIVNTGIFWCFTFPIVAFFFMGVKGGALWMVALFTAIISLWRLPDDLLALPYTDVVLRQLVVSLAVVTLGIFIYQVIRDRTERHELTVEYAKSEFLTLASHQLRTPISAVGWFSEMLLAGDAGRLTKEQQYDIQQIYDSNQRLASIVDAMLIVSGLELNQLEVRPESLDLPALSSKIITEQMRKYPDKQLQITEAYEPHIPVIRLDRKLTKIILQNIFSNAMKYTPRGGSIAVSIARSSAKTYAQSRGSLLVTVKDTGYGIAKDQQKQVFSKMFRAKNIRAKDTDGTGLGLYIAKQLLDKVGGKISFISQEGVGSTFSILLPLEGMKKQPRA